MAHGAHSGGFVAFYRRYTKTWIHALSTAALTIFGILTFVHRWFAAVAVAAYVLPPIVLYVRGADPTAIGVEAEPTTATETELDAGSESKTGEERDAATDDSDDRPAHWVAVDSPTDATLFDAVVTDAGAFAVGAAGVVLADTGDGWRVALEAGPGASASDLRGAGATADGDAVWFAGAGGALGRLDVDTGRHADFSAPRDITDDWTDAAVGGATGDETVLLANGSGEFLRGRYRDGDLAWDAPTKPGSGSSFSGVALADGSAGYLCDTNDGVFETSEPRSGSERSSGHRPRETDGGETVRKIGVEGADGTLTDVAATARGDCAVSADDGVVHRYHGGNWTPVRVGDDPLRALACRDGRGLACGDEGVVYESASATDDWERLVTPASGMLHGVDLGAGRAVAVGADGTVVERGTGRLDDRGHTT